MYKKIVVPVSFDDEARIVEAMRAAHLLLSDGGRVTLLHVIEEIPAYVVNYLPQDYQKGTRAAIEADLTRLAAAHGPADHALTDGHSARTILEWSSRHGADLLVIGSHRPGMQDLLMGSTATHVVRHAECAVLVLR